MLATFTWDGGGTDNNWTTAANWVGDVAPSAGDDLVFSGAVRTSTQNNFTVGTSFASVTFAASNFSLAGNRITVTSDVTVDSGVTSSAISLNIATGGSFTFDVVDTTLSFSGVLSGSNTVAKSGAGTLIVSASHTNTGATTISAGAIRVDDGGALGSGNITNNASLVFNRTTTTTFSNAMSGTGSLVQQASGTLILAGSNTYTGGTTISAGSLIVGNTIGTSGTLGTGNIVNDGSLMFRRATTLTISDVISGTGTLFQDLGTVVLTAANTYTGTTTIGTNAALTIGNGGTTGTLGTGDVLSESPSIAGTLNFNRSNSLSVANVISGAINVRQQGSGTLTISGDISGAATVAQQGSGAFVLSGNNTYTGTTTIDSSRTLRTGSTTALGTGTVTVSGTLDLNGFSPSAGALAGAGTVTSAVAGSVALLAGSNNQSTTFSGVVQNGSGTVALTKQGSGTLTLTGTNTYSGGTTISAGSLIVGNIAGTAGTLGSGAIVNNGALTNRRSGSITISGAISGSGTLWQSIGTLVLTGANTYSGTTTIGIGASITVGNGGTTGTLGSNDVVSESATNAGTLNFNRSNSHSVANNIAGAIHIRQQGSGGLTLSGNLSGAATVSQQGSGTLLLSGTNTYTGTTTIDSSRTLQIGSASALGTGTTTVNGTLDLNGYSQTAGALAGSGTVTTATAGSVTLTAGTNNQSTTFSGVIQNGSGTTSITKQGTGTLTLTGTNTYTGGTTISAGTLTVGTASGGAIGSGAIVNDSLLKFGYTGTSTVADNISGTGQLIQDAGTLILTGTNSYSGITTIGVGATLTIGSGGTTGTLGSGEVISGSPLTAGVLNFNRSNAITVTNAIQGTLNVRQLGSGILTLSGANVYTGTTTIDSGKTLRVGSATALGTGTAVVTGTLDLAGQSLTIGKLTGAGTVSSSATDGVINVGQSIPQSYTFSGVIEDGAGSLSLVKVGAGELVLSGTNSTLR